MSEILGVDIGGVIIGRTKSNHETFFSDSYLSVPPIEGVFDALRELVTRRFGENVFVVSRVSRGEIMERNNSWLRHHGFFEKTGISPNKVFYCQDRHEKADICLKLRITHFVDDRLEVLSHMVGRVDNLYLFQPKSEEVSGFSGFWRYVFTVQSWQDVLEDILPAQA